MPFISSFDEGCTPDFHDFDKKYAETWLYLEFKNGPNGFYYYSHKAHSPIGTKVGFLKDQCAVYVREKDDPDIKVSVTIPEYGYFNSNVHKGAYLFNRVAARQYKRGICSDNIVIQSPMLNIQPQRRYRRASYIDSTVLQEALDKNFVDFESAIDKLDTKLSVAVSSMFAISRSWYDERPFLWMYYNVVGLIDTKNKTVLVDPNFKQEVLDLLRGTQWKMSTYGT